MRHVSIPSLFMLAVTEATMEKDQYGMYSCNTMAVDVQCHNDNFCIFHCRGYLLH